MNKTILMILSSIAAGVLGGGCTAETHPYQYLSFRSYADAKVVKWMKDGPPGVKLRSAVPLEYKVQRANYSLNIRITDEQNGKSALIRAIDHEAGKLKIQGPFIVDLKVNERYPGYGYYFLPPETSGVQVLRFTVSSKQGTLIRNEEIPFQVEVGGMYTSYDGI